MKVWPGGDVLPTKMLPMTAKKEKEKDFLLKRQAKDYTGHSTIHGLAYLSEDGRPSSEG